MTLDGERKIKRLKQKLCSQRNAIPKTIKSYKRKKKHISYQSVTEKRSRHNSVHYHSILYSIASAHLQQCRHAVYSMCLAFSSPVTHYGPLVENDATF